MFSLIKILTVARQDNLSGHQAGRQKQKLSLPRLPPEYRIQAWWLVAVFCIHIRIVTSCSCPHVLL